MILRAVIDTNVLVSSLLSSRDDAATVQTLVRLLAGEVMPLYNDAILREYAEVLRREKFHFKGAQVDALLVVIEAIGERVDAPPTGETLPDAKDLPFYEVAAARRAESAYLVTGNQKHFPAKPFVVTASRFLEILNQTA